MRPMRFWAALLLVFLVTSAVFAQQPDADGDGIPDSDDFCWLEPGTTDFHGCTAENFPDFDQDGVGDPVDTCVDQAGLADNSGCPAGVTPDLDLDGVPDSTDTCPREPGQPELQGCPPDTDADGIPDHGDACPDGAGDGANLGCPQGVTPPDTDGDTVADLLDACPDQAGAFEFGGCPDTDGDGVPDSFDACPAQLGQSELFGCAPVTTATLPAGTAAFSPANASATVEVGRLVVGIPRFGVSPNRLALRASDALLAYDLTAASLNPLFTVSTNWSGYPVAVSGDDRYVATLEFPADFSTPPYAQIRDGASGAPLYQIATPPDVAGNQFGIASFTFNPMLPLLALAQTSGGGFTDGVGTPLLLWDVANNRSAGQLANPNIVINLAFSGDGTKLAADSAEGDSMIITLWDVGTQAPIVSFPTTPMLHFMGTPLALNADGTRIAVGYPDGSINLWLAVPQQERAGQAYHVPLFNAAADEVVSAVAFSPDGSLLAVAGGVPFSGGLTGDEQFPVYLLDAATGATLARLDGHESLIRDLAFTRDGRFLISAGDSTVKFWGVS